MRALSAVGALLLTALPACEAAPDDTAPNPCHTDCDGDLGGTIVIQVPSDRLNSPVSIELTPCTQRGYLPDGAPVVVVLSGSFRATVTPVDRHEIAVEPQPGLVVLYPSFPTDQGDFVSERAGDYRGSGARWAAETALQYATGAVEDGDGCTLADRIVPPLSSQPPWLHGQSNGGNLAMAMLADEQLELPEIAGVTTFETPASPQFVTVEVGSANHPLPVYEPQSCGFDASEGIHCPLDYSLLDWDETAEDEEGHKGVAYWDFDEDGGFDPDTDSPVWGIRPVVDGEPWLYYSTQLNQALREANIVPQGLRSLAETESFWSTRDASATAQRAVERYPELPFLILGTDVDHTLGIEDHAHVSGLAHALQQVGARWVRVNPDRAFLDRMTGEPLDWQDNPANTPTFPGDPALAMLPDAAEIGVHSRDYVTAGLLELMERRWTGAWADDLEHPLLP